MIDYKFYEFLNDFQVNQRLRQMQEASPKLVPLTLKANPLDLNRYFDPVPMVILGMRVVVDGNIVPGTILIESF